MRKILTTALIVTTILIQYSLEPFSNISNECQVINAKKRHIASDENGIKCLVESGSQIRFNNKPVENKNSKDLHTLLLEISF